MDEHRDEIDSWLSERVQPLLPPPGAFDRIQGEARRRRRRRVTFAAASVAAVVVAAAAVIPTLGGATLYGPGPAGGASLPPSLTPSSQSPSQTSSPPVSKTVLTGPVPADFAPESVTFVGTGGTPGHPSADTGWVLGRADAGSPCSPSPATVCLARTSNRGNTWSLVNPPPTGRPDGGSGVSQIRFANSDDGWAFGPQLWATHDGGRSWTQIGTDGMRVTALETRNGQAFAVLADCTGAGADFAAGCHPFSLWTAAAGSNHWAPARGMNVQKSPGGTEGSAQLVLTASRAYFLAPDGVLFAAPYGGTWRAVTGGTSGSFPCRPGAPQADGQPSRAMLASNGPDLLALCVPSSPQLADYLYSSGDGGKTWTLTGPALVSGTPTSLSGTVPGSEVLLATTHGIEISTDGGVSWRPAGGTNLPGGFSYVGMTTTDQGVALPARAGQHALWLTYDGGSTWQRHGLG